MKSVIDERVQHVVSSAAQISGSEKQELAAKQKETDRLNAKSQKLSTALERAKRKLRSIKRNEKLVKGELNASQEYERQERNKRIKVEKELERLRSANDRELEQEKQLRHLEKRIEHLTNEKDGVLEKEIERYRRLVETESWFRVGSDAWRKWRQACESGASQEASNPMDTSTDAFTNPIDKSTDASMKICTSTDASNPVEASEDDFSAVGTEL